MSADPAAGRDGAPARALLCQIGAAPAGWAPRPALFAMGGERRLTRLEPAAVPWPAMSERLQAGLTGSPRLRLLLATPALFGTAGWRPDWIDPRSWRGSPPGVSRVTLQLVSAAVGRRIPVSGWDLVTGRPKAVRYAVPSGSVYFFEVVDGELTADDVDRLWLQPIGVDEQAGRDGFGLVVPGIW